jgi:hypothetical protein
MNHKHQLLATVPLILSVLLLLAGCVLPLPVATVPQAANAPQSRVYFAAPTDGATVNSPVQVIMAAENFTIEPAGELNAGAGHLHIMVNTECIAHGNVIPSDATHLHYGKAQMEATLELEPGEYKLCLQAADGVHIALDGEGMTETITITVVGDAEAMAPRVYLVAPQDGATVSSPVQVMMGAENFTIEPAGELNAGAGHLHIMVNTECVAVGNVIPSDETHLHYGKAQMEATLELEPGEYTLCLQAADGVHIALDGDGMTETITITVE